MPRTIEHIAQTHQIASARRQPGQRVWDYRVPITDVVRENQSDRSEAHSASVANRCAALLRARLPAAWLDHSSAAADSDLIEIVECLEQLRADSFADEDDYSALEDLNNRLEELYDWADIKRIWLGPSTH